MGTIGHFTNANFDAEVLGSAMPVLVYFTSPWCAPCKMLTPIVQQLADEWSDLVKVGTLDIYESFGKTVRYSVMKAPTLILFADGKVVERVMGFRTKLDLVSIFQPYLAHKST